MMHRLIIFLYTFFMVGIAQTYADQPQTVYWYYNEFPPYYINSGPDQGKGLADQQIQTFIQSMPQFQHERVLAPHSRAFEMMKKQTNGCHTSLFKTPERAEIFEFSMPILENLPNGFITLRSRLEQLKPFINKHGQLRLDDFLSNGQYRIGTIEARVLGPGIDAVLKKHEGQKPAVVIPSNAGLASQLLKLVNQNEYDAVVGYSYELQYVVRQRQLNPRDFVVLPIAEYASLQPIYVACSKSAFGKQIITEVNRTLADSTKIREIEAAYRFWLDEESAARWDRLRTQPHAN